MQIFSSTPKLVVHAPKTIRVEGVYTNKNERKEKNAVTYEFTIDQNNLKSVVHQLKSAKDFYYLVSSAALSVLLFTNLIFNSTATTILGRCFSVLSTLSSLAVTIGTTFKHVQCKSALEKIKLLFGTVEQQNEELLSLAKGLPHSIVQITSSPKQ
ncbi:MAG: hypothetical protein S4CHLAM7_09620 [Chlamydiae bacterium]|nr:hypothetical protein [Chlamydiota bacterium]